MSRIPTAEIPREVLESLFNDFNIWDKIRNGHLVSKPIARTCAPSYDWPNATSFMIKHFLPNGKHVATTHCIKDNKGQVLHWDAKDFRLRDLCLWRA